MKPYGLPEKHCFCPFNPFVRMPVIDMRHINEGDIVYFTNYPHDEFASCHCKDLFNILIDYKASIDFFLQRRDFIIAFNFNLKEFVHLKSLDELQTSQDIINSLNNQLSTLNTEINSYPIKKQSLEISNLEQDLINKKLKAQILEKELGYGYDTIQENKELKEKIKILQLASTENINQQVIGTAKSRIKNQLTYKLGEAMIANSKSLWGYIRIPYILSYIKETHQKEQKLYQEKIKANPSLKLPPLETYPDYNEAIKIKEHLSYKLGEALIDADKSKLKLGYLTLWFKCKKITKEHKNNHKDSPNNPNH
ncbi:sugar transferase [Campylobacter lanienae]|uniref:sugar transferase n=1 Tax=Campylobacter lanienae TaxID=75658 RepID=UPI00112F1A05|nr:sugar transferase [Campylobacter lanienae]